MDRGDLGFLLAKATQRWNEQLQDRFRAAGWGAVRPSYGSILVPLFEEDGLRIGELARRARLSKQTMTTMVRLLERDGLVRRERDPVDGRHKVVNGLGEFFFEIDADRESGVIDMLAGPREDALQLFPTRVVPLADGGSAFTFTMFQAPGQPDEQFEGQYHSLLREFENLQLLFG